MSYRNETPPHSARAVGPWLAVLAAAVLVPGACKSDPPASTSGADATTDAEPTTGSETPVERCEPGARRCRGQGFIEECAPTGLEWVSEPCGLNEWCEPCNGADTCAEDRCIGPCEVEAGQPSSQGCSFVASRGLHLDPLNADGLVVANPNTDLTAVVQLYRIPEGTRKEEPVGEPVVLEPLEDFLFEITSNFVLGDESMFRNGGVHRVESNVPIVAYLHGPLRVVAGNDSSMLLPETTAGQDYVAATYYPNPLGNNGRGEPSWFEVVALEDFTTVTWTPRVNTAGTGIGISFVEANTTSETLSLNRYDTARIAASAIGTEDEDAYLRDISGTVITADKPIMVWSGTRCSRVPQRDDGLVGHCDPLQELLIPINYWGERYIAAASPSRGSERHYWRVFSSGPNVTITTEPQVLTEEYCTTTGTMDGVWDGTGCTLPIRGSFFELNVPNGTNFAISGEAPGTSSGAFMPVQYLQSARVVGEPVEESTGNGDPAMVQSVPIEQYLRRYVFSTGVDFRFNFVQVIRERDGAPVFLDDGIIEIRIPDDQFTPINSAFEVANYPIDEGTYIIDSGTPFGIMQVGWTVDTETSLDCALPNAPDVPLPCYSAYAYPGGMKSEPLFIP